MKVSYSSHLKSNSSHCLNYYSKPIFSQGLRITASKYIVASISSCFPTPDVILIYGKYHGMPT